MKKPTRRQALYNKMMLGELTLGDVFKLVEKEICAIEVDGYTRTTFDFEDGALAIWEEEYSDPNIFPGDIKVKVVKNGIEFKYEGYDFEFGFVRYNHVDLMDKIKP